MLQLHAPKKGNILMCSINNLGKIYDIAQLFLAETNGDVMGAKYITVDFATAASENRFHTFFKAFPS
jgi:hypothetical protein